VSQLAVAAVHGAPPFGDLEDRGDLLGQQRVHRMPARRLIDQGALVAPARPPAVPPAVGDLPQRARPAVGEPGRDRAVDGFKDQLLDLGGDPPRYRSLAPAGFSPHDRQLDGPRLDRLGKLRDLCTGGFELPIALRTGTTRLARQRRQRGVFDRTPDPDHRRYIHLPLAGRLGLADLPGGDLQKDLPLRLRRQTPRRPTSIVAGLGMNYSSRLTREDWQPWVISQPDLCGKIRRKPPDTGVVRGRTAGGRLEVCVSRWCDRSEEYGRGCNEGIAMTEPTEMAEQAAEPTQMARPAAEETDAEQPVDETGPAYAWQIGEPAELESGGRSRRNWYISIGAVVAAVAALGTTMFALWWREGSDTGALAKTASGPVLDGTYEIDSDKAHQTYNGKLTPVADATNWWAFRSVCRPMECVATGTQLSDTNHRVAGGDNAFFRFRNGAWIEDPDQTYYICDSGPGAIKVLVTAVISLAPQADGTLKGMETDTLISDSTCGGRRGTQGDLIQYPILAKRIGNVPPGVVADPATAVPSETPPLAAPPPASPPPPAPPPPTPDQQFIAALDHNGVHYDAGPLAYQRLLEDGHWVCYNMEPPDGATFDQAVDEMVDGHNQSVANNTYSWTSSKMTHEDGVNFVRAAISAYCPDIQSY